MALGIRESLVRLGLEPGAKEEDIKKRHRELVKQWHPDTFQNEAEKQDAELKIRKINEAYSTLKRHKFRSAYAASSAKKQASKSTETPPRRGKTHPPRTKKSPPTTEQKTTASESGSASGTFTQQSFDRWLSQLLNRRHLDTLEQKRKKQRNEHVKKIALEELEWTKRKIEYEKSTRIGMYRSLFNALVFGRILSTYASEQRKGTIGRFNASEKYNIDLRHSLIQDNIFYAVNRGVNILLKYLIGLLLGARFFLNIGDYYIYYRTFDTLGDFMLAQYALIGLAALLFIPDNLFQRYLLWVHRNLSFDQIQLRFKDRMLPQPYERYKHLLLLFKYSGIVLLW